LVVKLEGVLFSCRYCLPVEVVAITYLDRTAAAGPHGSPEAALRKEGEFLPPAPARGLPWAWTALASRDPARRATGPRREGLM